jgi:hypothetical protein
VDPEQKRGIEGMVRCPGWKRRRSVDEHAVHAPVDLVQPLRTRSRVSTIAEHDPERPLERAFEATQGIVFEAGVLGHARGHQGMGELEQ